MQRTESCRRQLHHAEKLSFAPADIQNSPRFTAQRPNKRSQLDSFLCPRAMQGMSMPNIYTP